MADENLYSEPPSPKPDVIELIIPKDMLEDDEIDFWVIWPWEREIEDT